MVTDVDAQVPVLLSGLMHHTNIQSNHYLQEYKSDIKECLILAEDEPGKAIKNVHSFGFFLNNHPLP